VETHARIGRIKLQVKSRCHQDTSFRQDLIL
jgi:hypothetical protein